MFAERVLPMLGYPVTPELAQGIKEKRFGVIVGTWYSVMCELMLNCPCTVAACGDGCTALLLQRFAAIAYVQVPGQRVGEQLDEHRSIRGFL